MSRALRALAAVARGSGRGTGGLALTAWMLLCLAAVASAQGSSGQQHASQPQTTQPTAAQAAQPAAGPPQATPESAQPPRTVSVDPAGGPTDLSKLVADAIATWSRAAPQLVDLRVDPSARSTITYPPPALLGPDTLSLDLRTPGTSGISVQVAPAALKDHPMVLLHEVGVLLGLPEGTGDVMAFAVPPSGEPDTPSAADVQALRTQRTYAPEDLNHDGTVDFYDLVLFGQAFGTQGVNLPADFNHDGRVDLTDLQMLRAAYTFTPPSPTAPTAPTAPPKAPPAQGSAGSSGAAPPSGGSSGTSGSTAGDTGSPSSSGTGTP